MTRKTLAASLAALTLVLSAGTALAATGYATRDVNVRAGAGTGYDVVGHLSKGDTVEIFKCGRGWCLTEEGYVSASFLAVGDDDDDDDDEDDEDDEDEDDAYFLDEDGQFDEDPLGITDDVAESIFSGFRH